MNNKKILAIETSCDETAVAVVSFSEKSGVCAYTVLGHALYSQADTHAAYGGVYPSLAKREHQKNIVPLTLSALAKAGITLEKRKIAMTDAQKKQIDLICERDEILRKNLSEILIYNRPAVDYIAVTRGPGLAPALWVGVNIARVLSHVWSVPLIGVNHMIGHSVIGLADGVRIAAAAEPLLALLVSGGHTEFVLKKNNIYKKIGETRDDALGESFDKVARMLKLGYPGGPIISAYASRSRARGKTGLMPFPRPLTQKDTLDFSYSGLKTAVHRKVTLHPDMTEKMKEDIAREFEDAAIETVIRKTTYAIETYCPKTFVLGGGVAANTTLRTSLTELRRRYPTTQFYLPDPSLTTDNAVMIALAAWFERHTPVDPFALRADAGESL